MFKFLPSYVGSKASYIKKLEYLSGENIVELFAGSAVISANLAKTAVLNDIDPFIYKILSEFDGLIVPPSFTREDYYEKRGEADWWRFAYCFQKMSFSGVFRYSKNGYNVPAKPIKAVEVRDDYLIALERWKTLSPICLNKDYRELELEVLKDKVVISDPPYETSQASYNHKGFDYQMYWEYIRVIEGQCKLLLIFDKYDNLPFKPLEHRQMTVNGKRNQNKEGLFIFSESLKSGHEGEKQFLLSHPELTRLDGFKADFIDADGVTIELKSDYYDINKTPNVFMERYSDKERGTPGGPWQALANGTDLFIYYFVKTGEEFVFSTAALVAKLEAMEPNLDLVSIVNTTHTTAGYKVRREDLLEAMI